MKKCLGLLLLSSVLIGCAKAPVSSTNDNEPPSINSVDVVKAQPQEATLAPGESGETLVLIQITNGYHVNANPPNQPYLKPTELELKPTDGISLESVTYPDPLVRTFGFSDKPLKVYEGNTQLKVRLKADKKVTPGKHNLSAKLRVQACDEKVCYAPGALDVVLPVNIK
ncbi:MAG TPA: protein-disulfide reductase DsbD domain-containing protein [Pyrinomonadaceae bacterium]|nr:protein-disulfide reductase DsbD domain-containing protein [Pyrinomonadaceae bacterium]